MRYKLIIPFLAIVLTLAAGLAASSPTISPTIKMILYFAMIIGWFVGMISIGNYIDSILGHKKRGYRPLVSLQQGAVIFVIAVILTEFMSFHFGYRYGVGAISLFLALIIVYAISNLYDYFKHKK